jgi:hypothetical protein
MGMGVEIRKDFPKLEKGVGKLEKAGTIKVFRLFHPTQKRLANQGDSGRDLNGLKGGMNAFWGVPNHH